MITTKDLRITIGQTVPIRLTFRDSQGNFVDLTGGTVYLSATADLKVPPLWQLSSAAPSSNGTVVIQDQTQKKGQAVGTILPAGTSGWVATGDADPYFWDAWAVDVNGNEYPGIATSRLSVFPTVTRIP
jgi:hypothetical protein